MFLANKTGYANAADLGNASKLSLLSISFLICFGKCMTWKVEGYFTV